ncbi:1-acyl-sn-glycerol-3-phosphate acyltransferase [Subtercola boreus]|uniref:1-acyl-sn-glycerol-3-phosphate acyltransferase n=1 Tax=Subtercola boreus TaxID=120213 RepID=A0A3E0W3V6_9MICO|nr:1-acyl-sn-glycerol-3-phosphate acyltransferase [Subtercola boreus]
MVQFGNRYTSKAQAGARFVAQRLLLKPVIWSMVHVTITDRALLKEVRGPYIVVANHSSHLDAPLILGSMPSRLSRYLAAAAAADYFFDVWWRKGLTALFFNAFPVDRSANARSTGFTGKLLKAGVPLLVFPEGTRSKDGTIAPFKGGAAALCLKAGIPCIPMALVGATQAMPRGRNWPVPGRPPVRVRFGQPLIAAEGENVTDFNDRIEKVVREMHAAEFALFLAETGANVHNHPTVESADATGDSDEHPREGAA